MEMRQGTPIDAEARMSTDASGSASQSETQEKTPASSGSFSTLSTTFSSGYHKTWLENLVGIDVNTVTNRVDWYWDNPYLTPGPGITDTCGANYEWYTPSGWGLHENNFTCTFDTPTYPQTYIDSSSYVHFKNGVFCAFTDTDAYYDRNHAYGYGNGNLVGSHSVTKSGTCSFMLSVNSETTRTVN